MPSVLKKEFGKVDRFFKKNVANPTNRFFKKGGQFQQATQGLASGIAKGADLLGKGVKAGNQILGAVEKSPYGVALAPEIGVARGVLGSAGAISRIGKESSGVLKGVSSGKSVGQITSNTLEASKRMEKDANQIRLV